MKLLEKIFKKLMLNESVDLKDVEEAIDNHTRIIINYHSKGEDNNTAGSTDTSSKIFLIGATSQAANPQTYSHDTAYVGTDGCLYSGGTKVLTAHQDISGKVSGPSSATANRIATFSDTTGKVIKDSGYTIATSVPSGAKFTDTVPTYTYDSTNQKLTISY